MRRAAFSVLFFLLCFILSLKTKKIYILALILWTFWRCIFNEIIQTHSTTFNLIPLPFGLGRVHLVWYNHFSMGYAITWHVRTFFARNRWSFFFHCPFPTVRPRRFHTRYTLSVFSLIFNKVFVILFINFIRFFYYQRLCWLVVLIVSGLVCPPSCFVISSLSFILCPSDWFDLFFCSRFILLASHVVFYTVAGWYRNVAIYLLKKNKTNENMVMLYKRDGKWSLRTWTRNRGRRSTTSTPRDPRVSLPSYQEFQLKSWSTVI